jgi:hypothetical protein
MVSAMPCRGVPPTPLRKGRLQLQRHPNAMPRPQPNRAHIRFGHPFIVDQSDTVANQLNPMFGAFSVFGISSSS